MIEAMGSPYLPPTARRQSGGRAASHNPCCGDVQPFDPIGICWMVGAGTLPSASPLARAHLALTSHPTAASSPAPTTTQHAQVHKFGGTCVAAAERIEAICNYLVEQAAGASAAEKQVRLAAAAPGWRRQHLWQSTAGVAGGVMAAVGATCFMAGQGTPRMKPRAALARYACGCWCLLLVPAAL